MNDDRRLLLAVLLCLGIYAGWSWMLSTRRHNGPAPQAATAEKAPPPSEAAAVPPATAPVPPAAPQAPVPPSSPERFATLETPELHLVFSSRGGTLVHAVLQNPQYRRRVDGRDIPIDLVRGPGAEGHDLETKLVGASWGADDGLADYEPEPQAGGKAMVFRRRVGSAVIEKRYEAVAPYQLALSVTVSGGTAQALAIDYAGEQPPKTGSEPGGLLGHVVRSYPNVATAVCRVDGKSKSSASDKDAQVTLPPEPALGTVQFGGLDERFFVVALAPQGARQGSCKISSTRGGDVFSEIVLPSTAGAPLAETLGVFLGPKDLDLLQRASVLPGHHEDAELGSAVGFGFWTALCVPMLRVMQLFERFIPNWGVAILVLTVVMKLLLWPLTHAQYRSMEKMKVLQPRMAELKKKHGEDKERLNLEMMKLYSEAKVNPLGGCLPMILQLPIWWALYRLLGTTIQLYREPFIGGWINDLTAPDPYFILPLSMGVTMLVTQMLSPQMADSGQQKLMMWMMPVMMTFFFLNLPAGLNLYIVASNLLSIAQQAWVRGRTPRPPTGLVATAGA
ncbi:MAG: membrane protein insertase YidC [Myxococcales bacterium]